MSESKILPEHCERNAYVYVRQSTMQQVRTRVQGKRLQYDLRDKARELGFPDVVVIDEDLGRSGTGSEDRPGFGRLLAAVCEGRVGAVFALEASRLARNNRDWHHLVDLCALTDTLVVDTDGIYDPRNLNDRLLLGLKGSMAEFELGLLRQRARQAVEEMVARGVAISDPAIGYVRTENNKIEMTPDRQVQEALRGVFAKFRELGTARQVLLWYCQEQIPLPYWRRGEHGLEVAWRIPIYNQILRLLRNPVYAGAYVHGRTGARTVMVDGRARKTRGHSVPMSQWRVLIRDHHAAYISWQEYLRNQKQLRSNSTMLSENGSRAAKAGIALLSGMLRCRRCGRVLHTRYGGRSYPVLRYTCQGKERNRGGFKCLSFAGARVDKAVAKVLLNAVEPAGIEVALKAWEDSLRHTDEKRKSLVLALQKAEYQAERARRQYDEADPENRLVAAELERRWEQALHEVEALRRRLEDATSEEPPCDDQMRERLLELGDDLEAAWNHPAASPELKKRVLRTLIEEIMVDVSGDPPEVILSIHWVGGVHTELRVRKNAIGRHNHSTDLEVVDLVRELAKVSPDRDIAAILNRLGYRTGNGNTWVESRVCTLRNHRKIPPMPRKGDRSWVTLTEASQTLEISQASVRKLIKQGLLPASQVVPYAPWVIEAKDLKLKHVKDAANAIRRGRPTKPSIPGQRELPFEREG